MAKAQKKAVKKTNKAAPKKAVSKNKTAASKSKPAAKKAPVKKAPAKSAKKIVPKKTVKKVSAPVKAIKKSAPKAQKKATAKPAKKAAAKKIASPKKPAAKAAPAKTLKPSKAKKAVSKPVAEKVKKEKTVSVVISKVKEIIKKKAGKSEKTPKTETPAVDVKNVRPSAGIYFSMEDLSNFLLGRSKSEDKLGASFADSKLLKKKVVQAPLKQAAVPKRPMAAASIADILGFNPHAETRAHFEEKDVPAKWKKYYKLLIEIKNRLAEVSRDMAESVAPSKEELTHEQAVQGMDAADIGSKNFEMDMAYSLFSNEQAILAEVDAAIERMRKGTYGVCEVTGKAIPDARLMAVPFASCTVEGQRIKEANTKRTKVNSARNVFGEMSDDSSPVETFEEGEE